MTTPHQRQIIRAAVVTALTGNTSAGANVFPTRYLPMGTATLPAIAVYTVNEEVNPESFHNTQGSTRELTRDLRLMIEGVMKATGTPDNPDDALDAFAKDIEKALNADETFGGLAGRSLLESTEIDIFEQGNKAIGLLQMVWAVRYYTNAPEEADVTLNDLDTVDVKYGVNGQPLPSADNVEDTYLDLED